MSESIAPVSWGVISTADIGMRKVIPAMQQGTLSRVDAIASRRVEHPVERHPVAGLAFHGRDADRLIRRDGELLAARFDDGSHLSALEWITDVSK